MTPDEWQEVWAVYGAACDLAPEQRAAFVESQLPAGILREKTFELLAELDRPQTPAGPSAAPPPTPRPWPLLGQSIGRFELVEALGRGGAGEVYRAIDPELGRSVAIKCIAPSKLGTATAVSSFIREARSASSLNHPGIVTVYEVIRSQDAVAIVMELVEGEPFRKLAGVPQPVAAVMAWGQRIAEALAASHAAGIIHRDIKPENLILRRDGYVKILDFGVAIDPRVAAEESPAGTFRYMSPEQGNAANLTPATDVFSLGIVLYELATGVHPFARPTGNDSTLTVAQAIAAEQARPPSAHVRSVSGRFDALVMQMLSRNPAQRPAAVEVAGRLEAIRAASRGRARRRYTLAVTLILVSAFGLWATLRQPALTLRVVPFTTYEGSETQPSLSPDGSRIAFAWTGADGVNKDIYVKAVGSETPLRLTTNPDEDFSPSFAPDGKRVAFLRHTAGVSEPEVVVTSVDGGPEQVVGRIGPYAGYHGIEWWPDGRSLLLRDRVEGVSAIVRLDLANGRRQPLTNPPPTFGDARPVLSPDGRRIAFIRNGAQAAELCLVSAAGGAVRTLVRGQVSGVAWVGDGQLLYAGPGGLWRIAPDAAFSRPAKVAEGSFTDLAADRAGRRLAFTRSYNDMNIWGLNGDGLAPTRAAASSAEDSEPAWAPDGSRFLVRSSRSGNFELYTYAADGSDERQITQFGAHLGSARWSPDGRWIVFDGNRAPVDPSIHHHNVFLVPASGGPLRRLTDDRENYIVPAWSSDSRWVYYATDDRKGVFKIPLEGGTPVSVVPESLFDLSESPDGKTLYYANYGGPAGIWQRPAAGGPPSRVPGTEGVHLYRYWQVVRDGIFFVDGPPNPMLRALSFATGKVRSIAPLPSRLVRGPRGLAVSADGSRILYTLQDLTLSDVLLADLQ